MPSIPFLSPDLEQKCEAKKPFLGAGYDELSAAFVERGYQLDNCGKQVDDLVDEANQLMRKTDAPVH